MSCDLAYHSKPNKDTVSVFKRFRFLGIQILYPHSGQNKQHPLYKKNLHYSMLFSLYLWMVPNEHLKKESLLV